MLDSIPCGARTRSGASCKNPAVTGSQRCRMHGGKGSGAPVGNQNALKHGYYSAETKAEMHRIQNLLKDSKQLLKKLD